MAGLFSRKTNISTTSRWNLLPVSRSPLPVLRTPLPVLRTSGTNSNLSGTAKPRKTTPAVEPQVIDEPLLQKGVRQPILSDGELTNSLDFPKVTSLSLSFKNIMFIDHMQTFKGLQTLRLDNNLIESVRNLEHLVNLTWLDLSFNKISRIEGLEKLEKLTDLSFFSNSISKVEGLDSCKQLNILSLGRNNISELQEIDKLRKFSNLQCLCIEGNPLCVSESNMSHILAFLPRLKYLDYQAIEPKSVAAALAEAEKHDDLAEYKEQEAAEAAQEEVEKQKANRIKTLAKFFLEWTEGLVEQLFDKTVEPEPVRGFNDYPEMSAAHCETLTELITVLVQTLEAKNKSRLGMIDAFEAEMKKAKQDNDANSQKLVKSLQCAKKKLSQEYTLINALEESMNSFGNKNINVNPTKKSMEIDSARDITCCPPNSSVEKCSEVDAAISTDGCSSNNGTTDTEVLAIRQTKLAADAAQFLRDAKDLEHTLLASEITLQEKLSKSIDDFEMFMSDILKFFAEKASDFFRTIEELDKTFAARFNELTMNELNAGFLILDATINFTFATTTVNPDNNSGMTRESLIAACTAFNEYRSHLIQSKEDQMQAAMPQWLTTYIVGCRRLNDRQHGTRFREISDTLEEFQNEVKSLLVKLQCQATETERDCEETKDDKKSDNESKD